MTAAGETYLKLTRQTALALTEVYAATNAPGKTVEWKKIADALVISVRALRPASAKKQPAKQATGAGAP